MVYFWILIWIFYKRFSHQSMHVIFFRLSGDANADAFISMPVISLMQKFFVFYTKNFAVTCYKIVAVKDLLQPVQSARSSLVSTCVKPCLA